VSKKADVNECMEEVEALVISYCTVGCGVETHLNSGQAGNFLPILIQQNAYLYAKSAVNLES